MTRYLLLLCIHGHQKVIPALDTLIQRRYNRVYQTVTTWGVIGLRLISLAIPKSAEVSPDYIDLTNLQYSARIEEQIGNFEVSDGQTVSPAPEPVNYLVLMQIFDTLEGLLEQAFDYVNIPITCRYIRK